MSGATPDFSGSRMPELVDEGGHVTLLTPLEDLGDLWPVLREIGDGLLTGKTLTVRYGAGGRGYRLRDGDVANVLRLTGFEPGATASAGDGREMVATRVDRGRAALSCTIVVPCRDEIGNVDSLIQRVPAMGTHTEILFVDGNSTDGTPERIEELIRENPARDIKLRRQHQGPGKAGAVYDGFDAASGDVLMILDADMTVAPEDLPRFYLALAEGVASFANGTRFVYPMAEGAMPGLNNLGNRAFGAFFSWVIGARITDTLCGTKALFSEDWAAIAAARPRFGGHDPWGDFDLLLGARYSGLSLVEVPVPYGARLAGESKMRPFEHGLALAGTCLAGVRELKLRGAIAATGRG
jgi:hypothetical protein